VRNLALNLPVPPSASQWPDLLNHGEQKGGGQPQTEAPHFRAAAPLFCRLLYPNFN
jgi:hypothetical protein